MLYAIVNAYAKYWWYYRELRASGQAIEARRLERMTIRHIIGLARALRDNAGQIIVTEEWHVLQICPKRVLAGDHPQMWLAIARILSIPVLDLSGQPVPLDTLVAQALRAAPPSEPATLR